MKKVVAYVRVSTDNQVGEDKFGIDTQKRQITDYCSTHNLHISDWFIEEGVSGAKLDRPELQRLLSGDVTNPPIEAIIVAKSDRLSRDANLYYWLKYEFNKRGVEIISVDNDYSQFGPMGKIMENLIVSFAEFERDLITNRTSKGRKEKASKGGYSGGRTPYGYRNLDGRFIIEPNEANVIRTMFSLRDKGLSLGKIAKQLNEDGFTTSSGASWYAAQVNYILKNKNLYLGMYKYGNSEWVDGQHEAIL